MNRLEELNAIITYCKAARRAKQLSLCKLLIRDDIQPRAEKLLKMFEEQAERELLEKLYPED